MSQWGLSLDKAVSLSDSQIAGLLDAYIERKQFEAKVTLKIFGEAFKPANGDLSLANLSMMGFGIKGFI